MYSECCFKSLTCYNYGSEQNLSQEQWEAGLKLNAHKPVLPTHIESVGFSPVFGFQAPELMSFVIENRFILFSLTIEKKKLSQNKLTRMLAQKKREIAQKGDINEEDISKDEEESLIEQIIAELCKETPADETYINAFIDTQENHLYINACQPKKINRLIKWIQRIDESFQKKELFQASLEIYLTKWLYEPNDIPKGVALETEATLKHTNKSSALFRKQELKSTEVITLINHDKRVTDIAISKDFRLVFNIREDGSLRKIKTTEVFDSSIQVPEISTPIDRLEAYLIAMVTEFSSLIAWMLETFQVNTTFDDATTPDSEIPSTDGELNDPANA